MNEPQPLLMPQSTLFRIKLLQTGRDIPFNDAKRYLRDLFSETSFFSLNIVAISKPDYYLDYTLLGHVDLRDIEGIIRNTMLKSRVFNYGEEIKVINYGEAEDNPLLTQVTQKVLANQSDLSPKIWRKSVDSDARPQWAMMFKAQNHEQAKALQTALMASDFEARVTKKITSEYAVVAKCKI